MRIKFHTLLCVFLMWAIPGLAVVKPHVISFGKWTTVKWLAGPIENRTLDLKVRALYVDTRLKEYTTGAPHEVTDRLFVVQRVFRLNDSLPDEGGGMPRWQWERGGWLLVDRVTGRIANRLGRVRSAPFDGQLVPGLHRVLWSFRRWEEVVCHGRPVGTAQAHPEEGAWRDGGRRSIRLTVLGADLAEAASARNLPTEAGTGGCVFGAWTYDRPGERR